ncbi:mitogen-activated protein kinase kinase kinase 1 [Carica papaya]|uniref:mitogen-activated protein kinase kinase kinase 1 n=1 Tax=Carica papaya TaxID=3649 RepID=UPI000B8CF90D|nr:mitogen-activated protein kinase kinase kinase 1 [Carica papaya]
MDQLSASSSNSPGHHRSHRRSWLAQPVTDRIFRAMRHHLRLLHRSESTFFVLGATGNVYIVGLTTTPTCTCPDRTSPCKHILFVLIRVLGVSPDDNCLRRRTLRPCRLSRLLSSPTLPESMAGPGLRERFHQLFFQSEVASTCSHMSRVEIEDGTLCPVCLEEIGGDGGQSVVACRSCRNLIHEECLARWKKSRGRRPASCVICRARWRDDRNHQDKYLNLSAYISLDDVPVAHPSQGRPCGG